MNNILKLRHSCLEDAPDCVKLERKLPLFGVVQIGIRLHQLYSPGPISAQCGKLAKMGEVNTIFVVNYP